MKDKLHAKRIVSRMKSEELSSIIWACDTEVADIDVKEVGPVGNGRVVCVSIFGGPDVDLGEGSNKALWIEDIGEAEVRKIS